MPSDHNFNGRKACLNNASEEGGDRYMENNNNTNNNTNNTNNNNTNNANNAGAFEALDSNDYEVQLNCLIPVD